MRVCGLSGVGLYASVCMSVRCVCGTCGLYEWWWCDSVEVVCLSRVRVCVSGV